MSLNIMIIEDESYIALSLKKFCISLGYNVVAIAYNSSKALELVNIHKIDVIISDINLNETLNGIDVCKMILKIYPVKIIFLTGLRDIPIIKQMTDINYDSYIMKPFRKDELETILTLLKVKIDKDNPTTHIQIDDNYKYYTSNNQLYLNEKYIKLTKLEQKFIQLLLNNKNTIVNHSDIDISLWDDDFITNEAKRQLIHRLKKKLPNFPLIKHHGIGYSIKTKQ